MPAMQASHPGRYPSIPAAIFCLLAIVAACDTGRGSRPLVEIHGLAMGTSWSLKVAAPPAGFHRADLGEKVARRIETIEQSMSTYRPDSEVSRFNASASADWFDVSTELCFVVDAALAVSRRSGGAFDVTVGPLVDLWGFGPDEPVATPPDPARIESAQKDVGYAKLAADCERPALRKSVPGLHIDLSAIAKGYAVDAVTDLLDARGLSDYLMEIGGEVRARGRNAAGERWSIGIEVPDRKARKVQRVVRLPDMAMATSGDYRNYFEYDGVFYSHTIDPRTGKPVRHALAEVSVVAATAMDADAWATALLVMGTDDGQRLADELGLAVLFQERWPEGIRLQATASFAGLSGWP